MKRSGPLKRTGGLRRSGIKRTSFKRTTKLRRHADSDCVQTWRSQHESCAACWKHYRQFGVVLELHHVIGGRAGRPDRAWNFLMLCRECHDRLGHGRDNLAVCMTLKRESDIEHYSRRSMQRWLARCGTEKLPANAHIPEWIIEARSHRTDALGRKSRAA